MSATAEAGQQMETASAPADALRRPVSAKTWQKLRAAWLRPIDAEPATVDHGRWSDFELAVCAGILGAPTFPTVGQAITALDGETAGTIVQVVARSFLARGLVSAASDGSAELANEAWMSTATFPDLTVAVEGDPGRHPLVWFGLRPDRAVRIDVDIEGNRAVSGMQPTQLMHHVLQLLGVPVDGVVQAPTCGVLDATAVADMARDGVVFARIRTTWRDGTRLLGGVFTCAVDSDGAAWEVEPGSNGAALAWNLRPLEAGDGMRDLIAEHLPGA